jgi:probable HAF family extracellular repeat protein
MCCGIRPQGGSIILPFAIDASETSFAVLQPFASASASALGIGSTGIVVGSYCVNGECNDNKHHGFQFFPGDISSHPYGSLDVPGASSTSATGINASGVIVGAYCTTSNLGVCSLPPYPGPDSAHGFVDTAGVFAQIDYPGAPATALDAINDSGAMVGSYLGTDQYHAFLLQGGTYTTIDPPGAKAAGANGINNLGQVVGTYLDSSLHQHGFIYQAGAFTQIDVPGAITTALTGINDSGTIVGSAGLPQGNTAVIGKISQ